MTTQTDERIPQWTLGDRLRKARSLTGLTTREFAQRLGVSQATVTNAENDNHAVRRITLNAWSLVTGVPLEWLTEGTATGTPPDGGDEPPTGDVEAVAELADKKRGRARVGATER